MRQNKDERANVKFLALTISDEGTASVSYRILPLMKGLPRLVHRFRSYPYPKTFLRRILMIPDLVWADVLLIQKKIPSRLETTIVAFFVNKIFFDIDDAIHYPHPSEKSVNEIKYARIRSRLKTLLEKCYGVIVGNEYLRSEIRDMGHQNVEIVPQPIDIVRFRNISLGAAREPITIGWIGGSGNIVFLDIIEAALSRLQSEFPGLRILVISKGRWNTEKCIVEHLLWDYESEVEDLSEIDIGLAPVVDNNFTRGKNNFKVLQYMSMGIPVITSPVGFSNEIIRDGENGFLAANAEDWYTVGRKLIKDPEKRAKVGKSARLTIEEEYSNEILARRYSDIMLKWIENKN